MRWRTATYSAMLELEIGPIRAFLPECNARYPSEGIKGTVPSFLPFPSITQSRNDVDLCMKLEIVLHSEELSKNASIASRGRD